MTSDLQVVLADNRTSYDTAADDYLELVSDLSRLGTVFRAMLTDFAERVLASGGGPVADVGCGPGLIAGVLAGHGLDVRGLDLSPRMVDLARRDHPQLHFEVGSMTELPYAAGSLAGVLAWWSLFHLPPRLHPQIFAAMHRALRPGGLVLVGFHVGDDEQLHSRRAYGHDVSLHAWLLRPSGVVAAAGSAGLTQVLRLEAAPKADGKNPQCATLFRK